MRGWVFPATYPLLISNWRLLKIHLPLFALFALLPVRFWLNQATPLRTADRAFGIGNEIQVVPIDMALCKAHRAIFVFFFILCDATIQPTCARACAISVPTNMVMTFDSKAATALKWSFPPPDTLGATAPKAAITPRVVVYGIEFIGQSYDPSIVGYRDCGGSESGSGRFRGFRTIINKGRRPFICGNQIPR